MLYTLQERLGYSMTNIVLKSLRVRNFGPFANEVIFTTAIDRSKKEYIENTFSTEDDTFNRISYIFGANGAGKSNFCKAIMQIQSFINLSPILASNNPQLLELQPVKLSANDMDKHFLFDINWNLYIPIFLKFQHREGCGIFHRNPSRNPQQIHLLSLYRNSRE